MTTTEPRRCLAPDTEATCDSEPEEIRIAADGVLYVGTIETVDENGGTEGHLYWCPEGHEGGMAPAGVAPRAVRGWARRDTR